MLGMMRSRSVAENYGVALLALGAALAVRWLMGPLLDGTQPFVTLYGAIAVIVWFGGYRPALVTAVCGYLLANYFFIEPRGLLHWGGAGEVASMLAYALTSALIVGFGEAVRNARHGAASYRLELVERQQRMSSILESISDAFYAVDREWRLVYVNSHAERYFGRPKQELIGVSVWQLFPEVCGSDIEVQYRRAMAEQAPVTFELVGPLSKRWIEVRAYPSAEGLSVFFRDIQGRKEAEAALVVAKVEAERRAEELEKARSVLQTIFDQVPEGITLTGGPPDFRIVASSKYGESLVQRPMRDLVGAPAGDHVRDWGLLRPDGRTHPAPQEMPLYRAAHLGELVRNEEFLIERPDGTRIPVLVNAAPVRDKKGEITGAISCWRDVTEAKAAYVRLEATQRRLQMIADSVPALIAYVDTDFRYRLVNRVYEEWLGTPCTAFEGRHIREIMGEQMWETIRPYAERALAGETVTYETSMPIRGNVHWLAVTYRPDVAAAGNVNGYVAHVVDITESKRIEDELGRRNERLALLWEAAAVLLSTDEPREMLHRLFGSIGPHLGLDTYVNYMLSAAGDALVLESCGGVPQDSLPLLQNLTLGEQVCGMVARERRPRTLEHVQQSDDPSASAVRGLGLRMYVCNPLVAGDRLLGTLSFGSRQRDCLESDELDFLRTVSHYVTLAYERLRLTRELREADRRKDEFLSVLAHELRNPLAPVRNGLQLLKMPNADPQVTRKAIDMMERQIAFMVRLIDDLLDVSRITRGKVELRLERVQLRDVIMQGVETARPNLERMAQEITVAVPATPVWLDADPVRLAQVVANLLNNACKFTERRGRIWVTAETRDGQAIIRVKDTGIGIPPGKLNLIFDMFVQADPSVERRYGGLGLGLTLVKSLVEMHQGTVAAHSEGMGRGAEFVVTLPAAEEAASSAAEPPPENMEFTPRRILVIDDSADSADSLGMLLTMMGHQVRTSLSGEDALEVAGRFRPELVMCDIGMPGMSGFEVARRLRFELGNDALLVALTGYGSDEDRARTRAAGFDIHLVKPVDVGALHGMLASALLEQRSLASRQAAGNA